MNNTPVYDYEDAINFIVVSAQRKRKLLKILEETDFIAAIWYNISA